MGTVKKKLLIATDNFLPRWDGIARFLSEIIPRLRSLYDITVVAPDFGPYEDSSVTLVRIPTYKRIVFGEFHPPHLSYFRIRKLVRAADIVFTQTIGPIGAVAIMVARRNHKPIVSFIHSLETELVPKALPDSWYKRPFVALTHDAVRRLYSKSTLLIVPSQGISEALAWQQVHTPTKEVHLGVDTSKFCPPKSKEEAKAAIHLAPQDIVIGYHGRISYEKDLITLFRAFMRLQHQHPDLKLLIVGDGVEGIKAMLRSRTGVILVGSQPNPEKYLQAMDLYVLPSLTETTSLSTLEAMSCAIPVIATEVGFVKDYIKPGYNGLFFPKKEAYYLAVQAEKLLSSVQLREMLGRRARETVVRDFDWDQSAKGIEEGLEEAFAIWIKRMKQHKSRILDDHFDDLAERHAQMHAQEKADEKTREGAQAEK